MARRMADDYQETFRARVESRRKKWDDGACRWVSDPDAKTHVSYYGPYATAGTAKVSGRTAARSPAAEVLRVTVERAEITWTEVGGRD